MLFRSPRSTLRNCFDGVKTHVNQQTLTLAEEVLMKWVKVMGHQGVLLPYSTLAAYASEISGKVIRDSWHKRFLTWHPDLKVKATMSLEKCCAKALNRVALEGFYDILEGVVKEFDIEPDNIWNMDEKGVKLGIGAKVAAVIDHDQAMVYSVEDGNCELVTIIEAVSANGKALVSLIIFQ